MDIRPFADLYSASGSLVSLYVDRRAGPSTAVVNELVKALKATADAAHRTKSLSIREDIERIERTAATADAVGGHPAWVVFASHVDGIFEHRALPSPVASSVSVATRPDLRPLRAMPRQVESILMVVERPKVRVYRIGEKVEEIGQFESDPGKSDYGGFQGYDEARATRHANEEAARAWREAASAALVSHQEHAVDMVVIAGHKHDLDPFGQHLHSYLHELRIAKIVVDPRTATEAELAEKVRQLEPGVSEARDEAAIRTVLEGAYQGRPVARGTAAVLTACNLGAVDRLVVSGPFAKSGVRCPACGWLARTGDVCPTCDTTYEEVADVVGAAVERVLDQGGRFDQVGIASALDTDGVAALLRFPLPS